MELELESLDELEELDDAALSDDDEEDSELPFEDPLDDELDAELLPASRLSLR